MSQNSFIAKTLRFIGIVLMALTGIHPARRHRHLLCRALPDKVWKHGGAGSVPVAVHPVRADRHCHRRLGHPGDGQTCERRA
ncbi:MAG: hypothetical protein MZV64_60030 [Ignavibacteriales bacterium]|nr:hypothetical protein [Ignavibacteriales bacterium]